MRNVLIGTSEIVWSGMKWFRPGLVTRQRSGVPADQVEWAAIDVETTGLEPASNRIVELAVVRFRGDGTVVDEYCTLVNPQRRMGAGEFHELSGRDVADAPLFADVWPDAIRLLSGAVALGHKLSFQDDFVAAETGRLGWGAPGVPGVCSLDTAHAQLKGVTFKLVSLHKSFTGEWIEEQHTALGGARALARTWAGLLGQAPVELYYAGPAPLTLPPTTRPRGRLAPRAVEVTSPRLDQLISRFPRCTLPYPVEAGLLREYVALLRRVVADEVITVEESAQLERLARRAGLTQQAMAAAHQQVWAELTAAAPATDRSRAAEQRRERLATNLGLRGATRPSAPQRAQWDAEALVPDPGRYLRGWRIGVDPGPGTESLVEVATRHGANVAKRLTGTVRWVAAADPAAATPTLAKSRELGLEVITVAEAGRRLTAAVAAAQADESEHIGFLRQRQQERAQREQFFRHAWLPGEVPSSGHQPAAPVAARRPLWRRLLGQA
jgi:DNA polymerase-3 subunit epsilon